MGLANITIKFQADLRGFSTEMQNSMRRIGAFGNQMQAIGKGMSMYITAPVLLAGAAAVKMASDYDESLNKVDVAFKDSANGVKDFAKTSLESFGIAEGTALDMAATYGDMATSLGLSQDKAAKMSKTLVGLAGDLSSFKNIGIDQANTALAGIFTGETESLKKLGIVMTEANLQNFALSKGIKTQIKDMDQASKVNLRYAYIMSVTKNAQGDFIRTGGGAANQMRIFQESMKQVAQQFGTILIPAFTKAITYVNSLIKSFGSLTEGTKTTIVVIAGVAAAIGPLLTVFGSMLTFIPNLITKFNALKDTMIGLQAVIAANPYTAAAIAIGLVAAATYGWYINSEKTLTAQQSLNKAIEEGNKASATEVGTLDKLYASATNVKGSITESKEAREKLQNLYPAYFKNLDDEAIKNGTAKKSYDELREAIFNRSRATAIDNELQKRANDRVQKEIELREKIALTESKIKEIRKGANNVTIQEGSVSKGVLDYNVSKADLIKHQTELLRKQQADLKNFNAENLSADQVLFNAKQDYLKKSGKLLENEAVKADAVTEALGGVVEGAGKIEKIKAPKNLDELKSFLELKPSESSAAAYDAQIEKIKQFRDEVATTAVQVASANEAIKQVEFAKALNLDPTSLIKTTETVEQMMERLKASVSGVKASMQTDMIEIGSILSQQFTQLGNDLANGIGTAIGAIALGTATMSGVFNSMLGIVGDFLGALGKSLIQAGVAGIAFKKLLANPYAAIAAGIALVALSAVVSSKLQNGPSGIKGYANGGIVGGTSFYGDKIMARVNSGEMIANSGQQQKIWNAMNSGSNVNITLGGGFVVDGNKLRLVLDRTDKRNNRLG
ncbi:hypothetical protein [Flavobacterium aquiphilum]|uniref:hypothetical protein n=1 Tax=Flavobacterium aquiphilum TaxID=3003261 RepID=UPI002481638B|nr:hypothetical protein [Flavobacterium aquiphilum]